MYQYGIVYIVRTTIVNALQLYALDSIVYVNCLQRKRQTYMRTGNRTRTVFRCCVLL